MTLPTTNSTRPKTGAISFSRPPLRLSWPVPLVAVGTVLVVLMAMVCWSRLASPDLFPALYNFSWDDPIVKGLVASCMAILFLLSLAWMLIARRADFVALWLMQNALMAGGYFFLPQTADALNIPNLKSSLLEAGVCVAIINVAGFMIMLLAFGTTYVFAAVFRATAKPPPATWKIRDERLAWLLRLAGTFNIVAIALTMVVAHTIPMLASNPEQARLDFGSNPVTRPFYNASMAILPFATGGLAVMFFRNPRRYLGLDGWLAGLVVLMQLLSGNRYSVATAVMVSIILLSLERKWARWWLFALVVGYLLLFVGASGFTSIWRQNRGALSGENTVLASSFREAYLGNNLIDYRDSAWVFSKWDHQPFMGKTYLSGMADMLPSGLFPMKRQWHLGQTALRIVGWEDTEHAGLRLGSFSESFLNFGFAGVVGLASILGITLGSLLRYLHLSNADYPASLYRNLTVVMVMQMILIWTNSSDAYICWTLLVMLMGMKAVAYFAGRPGTFVRNEGALPEGGTI